MAQPSSVQCVFDFLTSGSGRFEDLMHALLNLVTERLKPLLSVDEIQSRFAGHICPSSA